MLKWGLRWLAVFAVLLAIFRVVQDVSNLAVYLLFYTLIFSGFLSFDLLLAGLEQRFVTPKIPLSHIYRNCCGGMDRTLLLWLL